MSYVHKMSVVSLWILRKVTFRWHVWNHIFEIWSAKDKVLCIRIYFSMSLKEVCLSKQTLKTSYIVYCYRGSCMLNACTSPEDKSSWNQEKNALFSVLCGHLVPKLLITIEYRKDFRPWHDKRYTSRSTILLLNQCHRFQKVCIWVMWVWI